MSSFPFSLVRTLLPCYALGMQLLTTLNYENCTKEEIATFTHRRSARAVLFDHEKKVALLHVGRDGYYKLPGGGIDEGETTIEALKRECLEEAGCQIEVGAEIGLVIEYRRSSHIRQESYVYFATVVGEKGEPEYTDKEREMQCAIVWMTLDKAITQMETQRWLSPDNNAMLFRDGIVLHEARKRLMEATR